MIFWFGIWQASSQVLQASPERLDVGVAEDFDSPSELHEVDTSDIPILNPHWDPCMEDVLVAAEGGGSSPGVLGMRNPPCFFCLYATFLCC